MSITKKSSSILVLAGFVTALASGMAQAQSAPSGGDPLAHMAGPQANGQCWISTEMPVMEHGYGYWGPCKTAATTGSGATAPARRAHAEVKRSAHGPD
jgi:hypothetical protein